MSEAVAAKSKPFDPYPGNNADRVVAIALLFPVALILIMFSVFGMVTAMGAEGCGSPGSGCNEIVFTIAWFAGVLIPVIGFIATLTYTLMRTFRALRAFWVPIAGLGFTTVAYLATIGVIFIELG